MYGAQGIIRKMDNLGRIVIPAEFRSQLNIDNNDPLEISVEDGFIVLRKIGKKCIFCNNPKGLVNYKGKTICSRCIDRVYDLIN